MNEEAHGPDFVMHPGGKDSILFMQMVLQLSSLATLLLGKVPHPETGETRRDLEAAQMVIDQLAMLEAKTKGNLSRDEEKMLAQTLMGLRMAYVDAVNQPEPGPREVDENPASPEAPEAAPTPSPETESAESAESKKRFTKKY